MFFNVHPHMDRYIRDAAFSAGKLALLNVSFTIVNEKLSCVHYRQRQIIL